jgi:hypothetical protein
LKMSRWLIIIVAVLAGYFIAKSGIASKVGL